MATSDSLCGVQLSRENFGEHRMLRGASQLYHTYEKIILLISALMILFKKLKEKILNIKIIRKC